MSDQLQQFRDDIDAIDTEILHLLAQRMRVVRQIAVEKKRVQIPVLQPSRWQKVLLSRLTIAKSLGLSHTLVHTIWERIHEEALTIERSI